jgi:carotenoid 1,2-hydratase
VCLYGPGGRWAFTERPADPTARAPTAWTLGRSRIAWRGGALELELDERCVPIPRRVRGRVRLWPEQGAPTPLELDPDGRHHWWPAAARARAEVELDEPALRFEGQGYHDQNWGEEALEEGFARWTWSRGWTAEGALMQYDTVPRRGEPVRRTVALGPDGPIPAPELPHPVALPGTLFGIPRATRAAVEGGARLVRTLEDTPFYNRSLVALDMGPPGAAPPLLTVHETVDLDRFTQPWVQWMLPFRIRQEPG